MNLAASLARFHKSYRPDEVTGCWVWIRGRSPDGYGQFKGTNATRFAASIIMGQDIDGLEVCHRCDNPACVNPLHLFIGTHADNMADAAAKRRLRPVRAFGESNPMSKLTEAGVSAIAAALRRGEAQEQIARAFSVSTTAVSLINCGKRWRHITGTGSVRPGRKVVKKHDSETRQRAIELLRMGVSAAEVARRTGIARTTAQRIAAKEVTQ